MEKKPNWDRYMLDIGYILFASFIESIRGDNNSHYYYEIADYIKDVAGNDDGGQIYKIYENYQKEHILDINDKPLTIILTTMHKVKGLEFDVVIITPSDANLPLKSRHNYANMINNRHFIIASEDDDLADLDEERRLLFVAYTRAKKRLYIYKAQREHALENNQIYLKSESNIPNYTEKDPALDKYVLSFPAFCNYYSKTYFDEIKKGDPVEVCFAGGKAFVTHNGRIIGRLSSHSNILKEMQKNKIRNGFSALNGFFVSNIFAWTYEDTLVSDEKKVLIFLAYGAMLLKVRDMFI